MAAYTKPKVITLCGSTKFKDDFIHANFKLTMAGFIVISVGWFSHADGQSYTPTAQEKMQLDVLHKRKIDISDAVVLIDKEGYIGDSTKGEVRYAIDRNIPIFQWRHVFHEDGKVRGEFVDKFDPMWNIGHLDHYNIV